MRVTLIVLLFAVLAAGFTACRTVESGDVKSEGFLSHPELLEKGIGDDAPLFYMRPGVNFKDYPKVLIRPTTLWTKKDSELKNLSKEDRQMLLHAMHKAIIDEVSKIKTVVTEPGPGVMEIRAAILEAEGSTVVLDSITTFLPQALIISSAVELATGTKGFAGEAAAAVEFRDSVNSKVLACAVDRRHGSKDPTDVFSTWSDVESAFRYWAENMRKKMVANSK